MLPTKIVSNVVVKPVDIPTVKKENIAGGDIFGTTKYWNLMLAARKRSGKTSAINTIIQKVVGPDTTVVIFCPTVNLDPTYQYIRKQLEEREINVLYFDDIYNEQGLPVLEMLINSMKNIVENPPEPEITMKVTINPMTLVKTYEEITIVKKAEKVLHPKFLIIFDDMSHRLQDKNIARLMKIHRHLQASIILSFQHVHDPTPAMWKQCDFVSLFKGIEPEKLELLDERLDLSVPLPTLLKVYNQATLEPFSFLFIDVRNDLFRKNFNEEFLLEKK